MQAFSPADITQWINWIRNYDRVLSDFTAEFTQLRANIDYVKRRHPELYAPGMTLLDRAVKYSKTLATLKHTRDAVSAWLASLKSTFGAGYEYVKRGVSNAVDTVKADLGLSAVPVAVVAVGAAAVTLVIIAYWIKEAHRFNARVTALKEQEARGLTPQQAAEVVNRTTGEPTSGVLQSAVGNFNIPWTMLFTVGGFVFLAAFVLKRLDE
jgi:hypothetical protein